MASISDDESWEPQYLSYPMPVSQEKFLNACQKVPIFGKILELLNTRISDIPIRAMDTLLQATFLGDAILDHYRTLLALFVDSVMIAMGYEKVDGTLGGDIVEDYEGMEPDLLDIVYPNADLQIEKSIRNYGWPTFDYVKTTNKEEGIRVVLYSDKPSWANFTSDVVFYCFGNYVTKEISGIMHSPADPDSEIKSFNRLIIIDPLLEKLFGEQFTEVIEELTDEIPCIRTVLPMELASQSLQKGRMVELRSFYEKKVDELVSYLEWQFPFLALREESNLIKRSVNSINSAWSSLPMATTEASIEQTVLLAGKGVEGLLRLLMRIKGERSDKPETFGSLIDSFRSELIDMFGEDVVEDLVFINIKRNISAHVKNESLSKADAFKVAYKAKLFLDLFDYVVNGR